MSSGKHCEKMQIGTVYRDSSFARDLEDSKSTSERVLCIFVCQTLVPTSWMCHKQTAVSHSSIESEVISSGAGFAHGWYHRSLDLWDLVIEVLLS